jgi:hypothetical protein
MLALSWLGVAVAVLVLHVGYMSSSSWRFTWLVWDIASALFAVLCAAVLFGTLSRVRTLGYLAPIAYSANWLLQYIESPPSDINEYLITGTGFILLSVATLVALYADSRLRG